MVSSQILPHHFQFDDNEKQSVREQDREAGLETHTLREINDDTWER